jgi:hypothetical protein
VHLRDLSRTGNQRLAQRPTSDLAPQRCLFMMWRPLRPTPTLGPRRLDDDDTWTTIATDPDAWTPTLGRRRHLDDHRYDVNIITPRRWTAFATLSCQLPGRGQPILATEITTAAQPAGSLWGLGLVATPTPGLRCSRRFTHCKGDLDTTGQPPITFVGDAGLRRFSV